MFSLLYIIFFFFHIEEKRSHSTFFEGKVTFNWCDMSFGVHSWNPTLELFSSSQKKKTLPFFSHFPFPLPQPTLNPYHSFVVRWYSSHPPPSPPPLPRQQIFLLALGRRQHPFGFGARTSHLIAISLSRCHLVWPNLFLRNYRCEVVLLCNSVVPQ